MSDDGCVSGAPAEAQFDLPEHSAAVVIKAHQCNEQPSASLKVLIDFRGQFPPTDERQAQLGLSHHRRTGERVSGCVTQPFFLCSRNSPSRDSPCVGDKRAPEDDEAAPKQIWYCPDGVLGLDGVKNFRNGKVSAGRCGSFLVLVLYFDNGDVSDGDFVVATLFKVGQCGERCPFPDSLLLTRKPYADWRATKQPRKAYADWQMTKKPRAAAADSVTTLTEAMLAADANGVDVRAAYEAFVASRPPALLQAIEDVD